MTLKEILDAEVARPIPLIYLYKEGTFFKAYEMSAFYLSTVRGLKPVKRWCKSLEREYVTAEFVDERLQGECREGGRAKTRHHRPNVGEHGESEDLLSGY